MNLLMNLLTSSSKHKTQDSVLTVTHDFFIRLYSIQMQTQSKETRNNIMTWGIFKRLIPTFDKHSLIM